MIEQSKRHNRKVVLVFPCGSEIGLEIHRSLKFSAYIDLFGCSSVTSNHGKLVYKNYIEEVPFVQDAEFLEKFNNLLQKHEVDYVFPAHDSVVWELARVEESLYSQVIGSPFVTCDVCRKKKNTYAKFNGKIRVPQMYHPADQNISYPIFLKPNIGQGSKGTYVAFSREELDFYLAREEELLLLEYLPGKEYTVDCFTDRHGNLMFAGARERLRISNGISVDTRPLKDNAFREIADIINNSLDLRGVWFFQLKKADDGELVMMEIAPRLAGSMGLYRNLGINFALLSVFDKMDLDVKIIRNTHDIRMDRALENRFTYDLVYDHVYIDLDDTVILNGAVNLTAISFIFQCRNKRIPVHLLSRHCKDINETLQQYGLTALFETVVNITNDSPKSEFIKEGKSIFIDDSFAERKEVNDNARIPTFAPDSLESLIDWRM